MYHHTIIYNVLMMLQTALFPFLSLSSMNSDRYSGDFLFRLIKYSKSAETFCLKVLSSSNESDRNLSNTSFRSSSSYGYGSLGTSGEI